MNNPILRDKLREALKNNKHKIKYPDGYKKWKEKFDYWFKTTKGDLKQTLDIMYGPGGGVNNYRGSLYKNTDFKIPKKNKKKFVKRYNNKKGTKKSSIFDGIK